MTYKVVHIGAGGFGQFWCRDFLPPNVADGTIEVVALVDIDEAALKRGASDLKLSSAQCFMDVKQAFDAVDADFCTIVIPPAHHEMVVDLALAKGMDILSEKPIADTMVGSLRVARKVREAGRKMGVTMSHRFDQDKTTLRELVEAGTVGTVNTVSGRFQGDFRKYDSWSRFRHEMEHPMLIEGAVHHLDIIADLAGAECTSIFARTWLPKWAQYKSDTDVIVVMEFANGARGLYEGSASHATGLNDWRTEYFRVEGDSGTAILTQREVEVFQRMTHLAQHQKTREGRGQKVPLVVGPKWSNARLIEQFARWLDGGPPMKTNVQDNLRSVALVFAAIESARLNQPVDVKAFVGSFSDT